MQVEGNVVIGITTDAHLWLDCDQRRESEIVKFSEEYTLFYDIGDCLIMKSSQDGQVDLYGEKLGHYFVIFGKILEWDTIYWHVQEAYRLGVINEAFLMVCKNSQRITLRLNAKNDKIPPPTFVSFFENGEFTGVHSFLKDWINLRKLG